MKQLLQIVIILLLGSITVSAQNKNNLSQKQLELKEKQAKQKQELLESKTQQPKIKPVIFSNSKEYSVLKAEKRLAHYEIRMGNDGKLHRINPAAVTSTDNPTPCDDIPYVGPPLPYVGSDDENLPIALPFDFCFYGTIYNSCNVSINGNIQFSTNSTAFSSTGFPSTTVNMVAPFWSDCYLTSGGAVRIDMYATRMVVSWDSLGYYSNHNDLTNSFQCVLTDGTDGILPPGKNVSFYYKKMQWTTGDASDGVNGFPDPAITARIPATVGINEGNGVDYYLIGRFGTPGSTYDGPLGADDGISWLDGKRFYFNACPPVGANVEPVSTLIGYCDTLKVCGNDTLVIKNTFIAPEVTQTVSITASAPSLGASFSYSVIPGTNSSDIYMYVDGNTATSGFHTITMTAVDNGVPVQTSVQNFVVAANGAAINNLNGSIVVTPTLGSCPGGTVNASVNVTGGTVDAYFWNNNASTASTTFTTVVPADSSVFVTLTSNGCQKTILGHININPVPIAAITGTLSYCNGNASSTLLTAVNTSTYGTQAPYTYAWAATAGSLSPTNTQTTNATGGVYSVTVTNQYGCKSSASTTVTMNESPSYSISSANAISSGSVYCVGQDSAHITLNFGSASGAACGLANSPCISSSTFQVGTGNVTGTDAAYNMFYGLYESSKHQYLIRASELIAAGIVPGKINSIAINVTNTGGNSTVFENFSIKLKCVSDNAFPTTGNITMDNVGLSEVYGPTTVNASTGWNIYNFTQSYVWDGSSNLLVDMCFFNPSWDGNLTIQTTNTGFSASRGFYADNVDQCPLTNPSSTFNTARSNNRPNIRFGNCLAQQSGSQFDVVVTPTAGVVIPASHDSIKIALPGTVGTTCYTVSLINQIGGCSKDTVICLSSVVGTTQGTLATNNASVCPGSPVTLSATGSLTSYTIAYIDANGNPQTSVNASVTFTPESVSSPTFGIHTYTLVASGSCGAPQASFTQTVDVVQGVTQGTLNANLASTCPNGTVTLSAQGSLTSYTITYVDNLGALQTSANSSVTVTTPSVAGTYIYTLSATGPCNGPLTDFTTSVNVITGVTNETLTASSNSICPGTPITLSAVGNLVTYTISYTDDAGPQSTVNSSVTITPTGTTSPVFGPHTYTLSGMGGCGGPLKDTTLVITVIQGPTDATLTASNATVCPGTPVTLDVTGSAVQTYTIVYTDAAGTHTATPNASVTFTPSAISSPSFGVQTYTVFAEGPCSGPVTPFTTSVEVMQGVSQSTLVTSTPTVCPGTPITLDVLGNLITYTITYTDQTGPHTTSSAPVTFTPIASIGNYTYTLSGSGDCSAPLRDTTIVVSVIQGITDATLTATPNAVCIGSPITLSASSTSATSMATYTIQYNNGAGIQSSPNLPVNFTTAVSGINTYSLIAQGSCGAQTATFVTTATVNALTNLSITPMPNITKCFGGTATLNAIVTPTMSDLSYLWTTGGLPAPGTNSLAAYTASSTGVYSVVATASCAIPTTATVSVNQFTDNLSVTIIDSAAICAKTGFILNAFASGGRPAYNFNWFISPNATSISNSNPLSTNAPDAQGVYSVTVTVTDSCGFNNSDIQLITVLPPCDITIPNIITPNGDGANDAFKITNIEYHSNTVLTVFDRWGRKVYENTNYQNEWRGDNLNDGTYFYILDVPDDKKYNGYITIFSGK